MLNIHINEEKRRFVKINITNAFKNLKLYKSLKNNIKLNE
jgi:hypothetical protein